MWEQRVGLIEYTFRAERSAVPHSNRRGSEARRPFPRMRFTHPACRTACCGPWPTWCSFHVKTRHKRRPPRFEAALHGAESRTEPQYLFTEAVPRETEHRPEQLAGIVTGPLRITPSAREPRAGGGAAAGDESSHPWSVRAHATRFTWNGIRVDAATLHASHSGRSATWASRLSGGG